MYFTASYNMAVTLERYFKKHIIQHLPCSLSEVSSDLRDLRMLLCITEEDLAGSFISSDRLANSTWANTTAHKQARAECCERDIHVLTCHWGCQFLVAVSLKQFGHLFHLCWGEITCMIKYKLGNPHCSWISQPKIVRQTVEHGRRY